MNRATAGNGLRGHLLQALVQARNGGNAHRGFNPSILQSFGGGVGQKDKLQALLARVGGMHPGYRPEDGTVPGVHPNNGGTGRVPNGVMTPGGGGLAVAGNGGVPHRPVDPPMGLGHGGGGVPQHRETDPLTAALAASGGNPPGAPAAAANARAGDVTHMPGYAQQTGNAQMWEDRHPAAMKAGHIPNWVMEGLTNALNSASGGAEGLQPNHIQTILQHLSETMGQQAAPMQPPPPSYS